MDYRRPAETNFEENLRSCEEIQDRMSTTHAMISSNFQFDKLWNHLERKSYTQYTMINREMV